MNKQEFLSALQNALAGLPKKDRQKTLDFYSEMIDDRMEDGLTEEAVIAQIGTPEDIAAQVLAELPVKQSGSIAGKVWIAILLVLGSPVWLSLLIAAAAVLLAVLVVVFAVEAALVGCALGGILGAILLFLLWKPLPAVLLLGAGLVCAGLSIPLFFLCKLTVQGLWRLTAKTFRAIFRKG